MFSKVSLVFIGIAFSLSAQIHQHENPSFKFEFNETLWPLVESRNSGKLQEPIDKTMAERTLVTLRRTNADKGYHPLWSVVQDDYERLALKGDDKLEAYVNYAKKFYEDKQQFTIESTKKVFLPSINVPAYVIESFQRVFDLRIRQTVFIFDKKAYLFTTSARPDVFDTYAAEIQIIVNKFQFISNIK